MRMPKEPNSAQIKRAQAVLAWFAVTHDMAGRTDDAHVYANAITKLDADMIRLAQLAARAAVGETSVLGAERTECDGTLDWTESARGERARERWARAYYELNGAPENDNDR